MDNLFTVFLVLVFVLGPVIEQMKKKEQERKRQQQLPPERPEALPRSSTEEISTKPRESAAGMVPDDLWAILTGEQRPAPQVPAPLPGPARKRPWDVVYIPPEEVEDEEDADLEDVDVEVRRTERRPATLEPVGTQYRRPEPVSLEVTQANIISLETPLPSAAARHTAFHQKVDRKAEVTAALPSRKEVLALATRSELKRAFVLQEILGKPRGLE